MGAAGKIKTFSAMPFSAKKLFFEALATSAWVRLCRNYLPFKKYAGSWLGKLHTDNDQLLTLAQMQQVRRIHHILKIVDRYSFWKTECYTQALTGKLLLKRRNINSTIYIGFRKDDKAKFEGHAWLNTSAGTVTGKTDFSLYEVHSYFT